MSRNPRMLLGSVGFLAVLVAGGSWLQSALAAPPKGDPHPAKTRAGEIQIDHEWQLPNERLKTPFKDLRPITLLARSQSPAQWDKLAAFWNETTERTFDPKTGRPVERKAVVIKVPLGLNSAPTVPPENPLTVTKWALGKQLFFDAILSSDASVSCSSCHDPKRGYTDHASFSVGIRGLKGGMSAPTVFNSAYNILQFWDGRAISLEDQAQGPVQNPVEMFSGDGHAWNKVVERLRRNSHYVNQFRAVFGTEPTRDGAAKAIATYERTVLSGNSIHDRAELLMRKRVEEEETGKFDLLPRDYAGALKAAVTARDMPALKALDLGVAATPDQVSALARSLGNGRMLFFGKARCNSCHVGDNFTDQQFHNLGVGVGKDGKLPAGSLGRFGSQPTGHKDPALVGAFKTPTLRHLLGTAPYMHNGSERTLEEVIEFYDRGGNANEFLDPKMRDYDAEKAFLLAREEKKTYQGPAVKLFGKDQQPVVALRLNLTPQEKKDLVLFLRALQGDPADAMVSEVKKMPGY